jgi:hypothetical protein
MTPKAPTEAQIAADVESVLRALLPPSWSLELEGGPALAGGRRPDLLVTMTSPDGERVAYVAEIKREGSGSQLRTALDQLRGYVAEAPGSRPLFIAPWMSEISQERLAAEGVAYVDTTGNARLTSERPGLYIDARGAAKNPWPIDKALQTLGGPGAARALRALVDFTPPFGVRELASRTNASAATLSRVIDLLERDSLVERDDRGAVADVDWAGAIRRWAQDYDVIRTNESKTYLQPRGLPALTEALRTTGLRYALTGSLAANELAPFAPAPLAMAYVGNLGQAADTLDLREVETGANVILLEPYDEVVYARTIERSGLTLVNPTQLAVDLLTGPGRAPSEGQELLAWMEGDTDAWRT